MLALAVGLLPYVPERAAAAAAPAQVQQDVSVPVSAVEAEKAEPAYSDMLRWSAPTVVWPERGSVVAELGQGVSAFAGSSSALVEVTVGGLPVRVAAVEVVGDELSRRVLDDLADGSDLPSSVRLETFDHAVAEAADAAAALKLERADGETEAAKVSLVVDYSSFAHGYGGDFGSRLRPVLAPACALTTPELVECAVREPLVGVNSEVEQTVSFEVELAAATAAPNSPVQGTESAVAEQSAQTAEGSVVLLAAGGSSDKGTFAKTSLTQSMSWQAGGSSGAFTTSYSLAVPSVPGGLVPEISFGYSSGSVDGRTNAESAQTSWLGEGWSYEPGYIERTYRACSQDTDTTPTYAASSSGDLCWNAHNATLVWGGRSTELVLDSASGGWKMAAGDGSKVEKYTGPGNYGKDAEVWRITTADGTQYHFGLNRRPGWDGADGTQTHSAWNVPVFANHSGDRCYNNYGSGFANSYCVMTWRWNLDYVVAPAGNSMTYFYEKETPKTGLNGSSTNLVSYDRGGRLDHIEYGTRAGQEFTAGLMPVGRIDFTAGDRCLSNCWTVPGGSTPVTANWPDTPWDLDCPPARTSCPDNTTPSFWSYRRLAKVTANVWDHTQAPPKYVPVDEWTLMHAFPATGEASVEPALWLNSIERVGLTGGTVNGMPMVTFGGYPFANRAGFETAAPAKINRYRITQVNNEFGGRTRVLYDASDCAAGTSTPNPDNNARRCFPQLYTPPGQSQAAWTWWEKQRVDRVIEDDLVGGQPDVVHVYDYWNEGSNTGVLWRHNDARFGSRLSDRTWSDFRGWPTVVTTVGSGATATKTKRLYFRGMDGDRTDAGWNTRTGILITNSLGRAYTDIDYRAGFLFEEQIIDPSAVPEVVEAKTINFPTQWQTGTRTITGAQPSTQAAFVVETGFTHQYTRVTSGGTPQWRTSKTSFVWGSDPDQDRLVATTDHGLVTINAANLDGVDGSEDDETTTCYQYASTAAAWMTDRVSLQYVADGNVCTFLASTVLSGTRTSYDNQPPGVLPGTGSVRGLATKVEQFTYIGYPSLTAYYAPASETGYDAHGRPVWVKDGLGRQTSTAYTPATDKAATSITVTNAKAHATTSALDVLRGLPLTVTDANGIATTGVYDGLGRLTQVWKENRAPSQSGGTPDVAYDYDVRNDGTSSVTTRTITPNNKYVDGRVTNAFHTVDTVEIYDGLLRPRQTQSTAPDGKRVIADTIYNDSGAVVKQSTFYNNASGPGTTLVTAADSAIERQTRYVYDGLGRQTAAQTFSADVKKWETTTTYEGDRTTVVPPAGGTVTQDRFDVRGKLVEKRQMHAFAEYEDLFAADFTNDGKTDMVAIRAGSGRRGVFYGKGDGTFTYSPTYTSTGWDSYRDWAAGEFSGDTNTDAVAIRKSDGALYRYHGNGAGGLSTATQLATGFASHRDLVAGDFTGDGKSDLLAIRSSDGMLQRWTGNGSGTLTGPTDVSTGWANYKHLVAGDIQGDGKIDLIAITTPSGMLRRWLGNGTGGFDAGTDLGTGWSTRVNLTAGDFNGDGKTDLYGASTGDSTLRRYHGNGTTFTSVGSLDYTEGHGYDPTSYGYDPLGQLTSVTDPGLNQWSYAYDKRGRQTSATDPDAGTSTKTYDNAGQLTTTQDGRLRTLAYKYDELGRKTELRDNDLSGPLRASWIYDTVEKGQLTSATRYDNGLAYTTSVDSYDNGYRPLTTKTIIPAHLTNGALAQTYTTTATYKVNGAPATVTLPGIAGPTGLAAETVTTTYTDRGLPATVTGTDAYLADVTYAWDGATLQTVHTASGISGKRVQQNYTYEAATARLLTAQVDTEKTGAPGTFEPRYTSEYGYDNAGNITAIAGKTDGTRDQVECFTYDYLRRMTQAWTNSSWNCTTAPVAGGAGADPYWRQWTFDVIGNRRKQIDKGAAGADTTWNYTAPASGTGAVRPHSLTRVTASGPLAGTSSRDFEYDNAGNTTVSETETGTRQELDWDNEGHLASLTEDPAVANKTTSYLYDPDGNRLIGRAPDKTTLYLGPTELELTASGTVLATRYYTAAGQNVAVRNAGGLRWTCADHHGTQQVQINSANLADGTRNRTMPYGEPRGTQDAFAGTKGYVGGTTDDTGLTHLGAREYDPTVGRFISVDPLMDMTDPQQWNGFAYSNSSPVTLSDPSGLTHVPHLTGGGGGGGEWLVVAVRALWRAARANAKSNTRKPAPPKPKPKPTPKRDRDDQCESHSFAPDTRVLMADGSTKRIDEINVDDAVAATDPAVGAVEAKSVTQLHSNTDVELTTLTVKDDISGETSTIETTQNHPFWDATDEEWVNAGDLKVGHELLAHDDKRVEGDGTGAGTGGGGPGIRVVAVENYSGVTVMRDLTVADIHTYYVIAGDVPVLVHNCDYVYRSDGGVPPDDVFEIGFQAWGSNMDLYEHVHGVDRYGRKAEPSGYVSTTKDEDHVFERGGNVYVIDRRRINGIDVNVHMPDSKYAYEHEVAVPYEIDPSAVVGVFLIEEDWRWVPNPNYVEED